MGTLSRTAYELKAVLQKPSGCCVCRFVDSGVRREIDALFYERVTDRDVRDAIRRARGFCRRHSRMVSEQADALGTALIMQDVLINELRDIESGRYDLFRQSGPFGRLKEQRRAELPPCPVCIVESDLEDAAIDALLEGLDDLEIAPLFQASDGLCLPHLRRARERCRDDATWTLVMETERRVLQTLADTLGQFARKSDYRFSGQAVTGEEAAAWRKALDITSGMSESR